MFLGRPIKIMLLPPFIATLSKATPSPAALTQQSAALTNQLAACAGEGVDLGPGRGSVVLILANQIHINLQDKMMDGTPPRINRLPAQGGLPSQHAAIVLDI